MYDFTCITFFFGGGGGGERWLFWEKKSYVAYKVVIIHNV